MLTAREKSEAMDILMEEFYGPVDDNFEEFLKGLMKKSYDLIDHDGFAEVLTTLIDAFCDFREYIPVAKREITMEYCPWDLVEST